MKKSFALMTVLFVALAVSAADVYSGRRISLDKKDGIYKVGDTATCRFTLLKDKKPVKGVTARMVMRWEGRTVETRDFVTTGKPVEFSFTGKKPGWVYFGFEVLGKNGKPLRGKGVYKHRMKPTIVSEIGAMFSPEKILHGAKRPADFEEFWAARRAKLDKVPVTPKYQELKSNVPGIKLFAVEVPSCGDYPVTGYLAYPENAAPKTLPAYVQWASWSASDANRNSVIGIAKNGGIGFAPTWHGRPVNKGKDYYNYKTTIKIEGGLAGINDRETWCFSDMYYRVMRALDFIKSRPEWDGKNLISIGGSLGGAQSTAAAALDKDVTLALISIPCFCEFNATVAGRRDSIPLRQTKMLKTKRNGDMRPWETAQYFDCVNFAPMITCEVYVCTGFTDELCPPSNVFAVYNALPAGTNKTMYTNPRTGHYGTTKNVKGNAKVSSLFRSAKINTYDVK